MKQKKVTKQSKHRLMLFGTISCILIIYCLINLSTYIININNLKKTEKNLNEKLVTLQEDGTNLKTEIKKLKDPDYLARYARENFLYSKDGEFIIKMEQQTADDKISDISKPNYKAITIISSSFAVFVVGYIIRKNRK